MVSFSNGCSDRPTEPAANPPSAQLNTARAVSIPKTYDQELMELAERVPGFAGIIADSTGTAHAIWASATDTTVTLRQSDAVEVGSFIAAKGLRAGRGTRGGSKSRAVRFSARELLLLRDSVERTLDAVGAGPLMTDFNEMENSVDIGVADAQALGRVNALLATARLSSNAIRVRVVKMPVLFQTLQDDVPPIRGGMAVVSTFGSSAYCTITPPISQWTGPWSPIYDDVVFTASHCTTTFNSLGANGGDNIYQAGRYIGREVSDAAARPRSSFPGCPNNGLCRWADLAVIRVGSQFSPDDPWRLNTIANTGAPHGSFFPPYPLTIVDQDTLVAFDATYLPVGTVVRKQGARSGTTQGPISQSCVRLSNVGVAQHMMCQYVVNAHAGPGDSGAPVYTWVANPPYLGGNATFRGIVWGGPVVNGSTQYWASPTQNIMNEALYLFDR